MRLFSHGTQAYEFEKNRFILLRHTFSNQWFVLGRRKDRKSGDTQANYIHEAMIQSNLPGTGNKTISPRVVDCVLNIVSPIVSAALSSVSKFVNLKQVASFCRGDTQFYKKVSN
jgi:hypothetical protein